MKRNPTWLSEITSIVESELAEKYGVAPDGRPYAGDNLSGLEVIK